MLICAWVGLDWVRDERERAEMREEGGQRRKEREVVSVTRAWKRGGEEREKGCLNVYTLPTHSQAFHDQTNTPNIV